MPGRLKRENMKKAGILVILLLLFNDLVWADEYPGSGERIWEVKYYYHDDIGGELMLDYGMFLTNFRYINLSHRIFLDGHITYYSPIQIKITDPEANFEVYANIEEKQNHDLVLYFFPDLNPMYFHYDRCEVNRW